MKTLQDEFEFVRTTFFPGWDPEREWGVESGTSADDRGYCHRESKTIWIFDGPYEEDELRSLLIHEFCHAVADPECPEIDTVEHGDEWQGRLLKAGYHASDLGMHDLAVCVWRDLQGWVEKDMNVAERVCRKDDRARPFYGNRRLMVQTLKVLCSQESLH